MMPLPERPQNIDEARDRGFDPESVTHDRVTPEPLDDVWQKALDASIAAAHERRYDCEVADCGEVRCDSCSERMTCLGPEPRICGTTCADCPCDCSGCLSVRQDLRDELLRQLEREAD